MKENAQGHIVCNLAHFLSYPILCLDIHPLVTENDWRWNMNIGIMQPTTIPNITRIVSEAFEKKRDTYSIVYSSGRRTMFIRSRMAL